MNIPNPLVYYIDSKVAVTEALEKLEQKKVESFEFLKCQNEKMAKSYVAQLNQFSEALQLDIDFITSNTNSGWMIWARDLRKK